MERTGPGSTAAALEAYGLDPDPFEDGQPVYRPGEDTGWEELEDTVYETALELYDVLADIEDRTDFARRQRRDPGLEGADWIEAVDPDPQAVSFYEAMDAPDQDDLTDAVMEDIHLSLYAHATAWEDSRREAVEEMELLLGRASFDAYADVVESDHTYTVAFLEEPEPIRAVHDAVGSCIAEDTDRPLEYAEDPFTMVAAIERDGEQQGYMRTLLLEDDDGQPFLGLDTIEVPHRDQMEHADVIRAGGLALCHLADETGVDRVIGTDARVSQGLRQAMSNTAEEVVYEKPGDRVFMYTFHNGLSGLTGYRLWEDPDAVGERYGVATDG